jgi:hypothetical protein
MPSAQFPFEDVFDEKQWKKARDTTGLTTGLTEKVSMGEEFKAFQRHQDVPAARKLLHQLGIYETQLKSKHAKEKYYTRLLKVVEQQKAAITIGIELAEGGGTQGNEEEAAKELTTLLTQVEQDLKGTVTNALNKAETFLGQGDSHLAEDQVGWAEVRLQESESAFEHPETVWANILKRFSLPGDTQLPGAAVALVQRGRPLHREQQARCQQLRAQCAKLADPNAPRAGEARQIYFKVAKDFKSSEAQLKGQLLSTINELLQRCQGLPGNPGLIAKPETAAALADKIMEAIDKVDQKAMDLLADFGADIEKVRKEVGAQNKATQNLQGLLNQLQAPVNEIMVRSRTCRQQLRKALLPLQGSDNPQLQLILRKLEPYGSA